MKRDPAPREPNRDPTLGEPSSLPFDAVYPERSRRAQDRFKFSQPVRAGKSGPAGPERPAGPEQQPEFENPTLIVAWDEDAGKLGPKVIEYISRRLDAKSFCEVEPTGFFSIEGVAVENDIAQFPEGKFYYCGRKDLVVFKGNEPCFERHNFLNGVCDLAQHYCKIRQLYTLGGTVSPVAHTDSRRILAVFNQEQLQQELAGLGLENMNWQGPPAISSFLLWVAQRRAIPGVSLWTEIPFYLAAGEDFQAIKTTLSFLDKRFDLALDFAELDEQVRRQNAKIDRLRQDDAQIDRYIRMLESKLSLSADEQVELTKKVTEVLEETE